MGQLSAFMQVYKQMLAEGVKLYVAMLKILIYVGKYDDYVM